MTLTCHQRGPSLCSPLLSALTTAILTTPSMHENTHTGYHEHVSVSAQTGSLEKKERGAGRACSDLSHFTEEGVQKSLPHSFSHCGGERKFPVLDGKKEE